MEVITYNKAEDSQRRVEAKNITFEEENKAVSIISDGIEEMISMGHLTNEDVKLVQKFIDNYQNLNHHKCTTLGIYGTDSIEMINKIKETNDSTKFWEIIY